MLFWSLTNTLIFFFFGHLGAPAQTINTTFTNYHRNFSVNLQYTDKMFFFIHLYSVLWFPEFPPLLFPLAFLNPRLKDAYCTLAHPLNCAQSWHAVHTLVEQARLRGSKILNHGTDLIIPSVFLYVLCCTATPPFFIFC